jgi:photosystem II stability/assembly factor-like uncharacterized protein
LYVNRLAAGSGKVFAGTNRGMYVSSDSGRSWQLLHEITTDRRVFSVLYHNGALHAGTLGGIHRSNDLGAHWSLSSDIGYGSVNELLAINLTTLVAGTLSKGIFRSSDAGNNWVMVDSQEHSGGILAGTIKDGSVFFGTDRSTILRSTDYGNHWSDESSPDFYGVVYGVTSIDGILYASSYGDMHRSSDNGTTWTKLPAPYPYNYTTTIFRKGDILFIGMHSGGLFRSTDGGERWVELSLADGKVDRIGTIGSYILTKGPDILPLCTTDGGKTWSPPSQQFDGLSFIARKDSALYASTYYSGNYRSLDSGRTWQQLDSLFIGYDVQTLHLLDTVILAGTRYFGVMRSSDDGKTFVKSSTGLPEQTAVTAFASIGDVVYASTSKGFYASTDFGVSWTLISGATSFKVLLAKETLLFAISGQAFMRSSDQGITWETSTDARFSSIALSDTILFASTFDAGVFRSTNYGQVWVGMSDGLDDTTAYTVHCDGDVLYAGTPKGVYTTKPTSSVVLGVTHAPQVTLMPSPAQTSLTIRTSGRVDRFSICDVTGRRLATNVDYKLDAGYVNLTLDIRTLDSGIYIALLTVDGNEVARKFTVIK